MSLPLWSLKRKPALRHDYFDRLDRFTGFAARGLLVPVARSEGMNGGLER